ncbi:MAG: hypothetical protein EAZ55_06170 [Cytophagales bacterium]|nr:MAG: hypothetical protein EAZ55_06170 [Cytophagales bacterium]
MKRKKRKKAWALLLTFFLGHLGIHNLYLRQNFLFIVTITLFFTTILLDKLFPHQNIGEIWAKISTAKVLIEFVYLMSLSYKNFDKHFNPEHYSSPENEEIPLLSTQKRELTQETKEETTPILERQAKAPFQKETTTIPTTTKNTLSTFFLKKDTQNIYIADEIEKLNQLFEKKVITFEELENRKKRLLDL